ncbi:hypothetical protein [Paenibacillus sp. NPDC055715]
MSDTNQRETLPIISNLKPSILLDMLLLNWLSLWKNNVNGYTINKGLQF